MICEECSRKIVPITVHDDTEDADTCDTCGSLAYELPGFGWVCLNAGVPLVEEGECTLYHADAASFFRRLWRKFE